MLLTRTVRGIPTEVPLDVDDGVSEPCAAWLDNVELMPKAYLVERMCTVGFDSDSVSDGAGDLL